MDIALIVAFVALGVSVLAIPTFLQMRCGAPQITIEFKADDSAGKRMLKCDLYNHPIDTKSRLHRMGVRRESAEEVIAHLSIREFGTNRVILPDALPEIKTYKGYASQKVSLPASLFPISVPVAFYSEDKKVKAVDNLSIVLDIGKYIVEITVVYGNKASREEGILVVTGKSPYMFWEA